MSRKTLTDWKILVEKQMTSGLSVVQFCQQQNLNPKYFYSRKLLIYKSSNNTGFVQAQVVTQKTSQITIEHKTSIKLSTSVGDLFLPSDTSAQFIIEILNGLTS
ncbi:MAG: hypothetical protein QM500_18860 [Methylococcales bacterium]